MRRTVRRWLIALGLCAVGLHLAAVALWVGPPSPIVEATGPALRSYVQPFFAQFWSVFAPTAYNADVTVSIRARTGASDSPTSFVNLSAADYAAIRHNPLPPFSTQTTRRLHSLLVQDLQNLPSDVSGAPFEDHVGAPVFGVAPKSAAAAERFTPAKLGAIQAYLRTERTVYGYATLWAYRMWGTDITAVQVRLQTRPVPRFPDRQTQKSPETTTRLLGWRETVPFDTEVVQQWVE